MDREVAAELKSIDDKAAETYIEIIRTQAEMSDKIGTNFEGWVKSISGLSVTIGSAIIPLSLVANGSQPTPSTTTLGALALILLGAVIQFRNKHRLEKAALQTQILGWRHRAILAERRGGYKKLLNGKISAEEYQSILLKGVADLENDRDILPPSRRPNIEIDIYLLIFLTGLAFIALEYVPKDLHSLSWKLIVVSWIAYSVYVSFLVYKVIQNNNKISEYEERIKNSGFDES